MLTQETLKSLLHYDPETGIFTRLVLKGGKMASTIAGTKGHEGYISIQINHKIYKAHRLAFLYVYGRFPNGDVDHIDHNKNNNSIVNLRECSESENSQNQIAPRSNNKSSGYLGVSFHRRTNKFQASIQVNKKSVYIGLFPTAIEAHQAYLIKKSELHPFNTLPLIP